MRQFFAVAAVLFALAPTTRAAGPPLCTRALLERLARAGRAEARVTITTREVELGTRSRRGVLAIELPDRLRLDYAAGGERLTARGDGGEWLQPAGRQMLIMGPEQAARAAGLWRALRGTDGAGFAERKLAARTFELITTRAGVEAETVRVVLGEDGLPSVLEMAAGDLTWTVRLRGWRFEPARGRSAFVLRAPPDFEVLDMP